MRPSALHAYREGKHKHCASRTNSLTSIPARSRTRCSRMQSVAHGTSGGSGIHTMNSNLVSSNLTNGVHAGTTLVTDGPHSAGHADMSYSLPTSAPERRKHWEGPREPPRLQLADMFLSRQDLHETRASRDELFTSLSLDLLGAELKDGLHEVGSSLDDCELHARGVGDWRIVHAETHHRGVEQVEALLVDASRDRSANTP